jgi:DNA-binding GntR family transcriptional regulator
VGARLDERELADAMGISRTPLREAIGKLAKEGLVEHLPYQGNFVRTFTAKQVSDLYEVRRTLEVLAIGRAVERLSDEDLASLRGILNEVRDALAGGDLAAFGEADRRFHKLIADLADNETLSQALDRLDAQVRLIRRVANRDPGLVRRTTAEREELLAALTARDASRAARLMEAHIDGVRLAVVAQFEGDSGTGRREQAKRTRADQREQAEG